MRNNNVSDQELDSILRPLSSIGLNWQPYSRTDHSEYNAGQLRTSDSGTDAGRRLDEDILL